MDFVSSVKRNLATAAYAQFDGGQPVGVLKASDAGANKYGEGPARA
jgi:hypothetical protein